MTRGKALACLLGILLAFTAPLVFPLLLGERWTLVGVADSLLYGVVGAALGYVWPRDGWRLGAWLGLCWLAFIPLNFLLAGDTIDWKTWSVVREVRDLLGFSMPVFAGCFGAAAGAFVKEHRSEKA